MRHMLLTTTLLTALGAFALPAAAQDCNVTVGVVMELTGPAGASAFPECGSVRCWWADVSTCSPRPVRAQPLN